MTVGRFLVLLSGAALGMMAGPTLAIRLAWEPMSDIGNDLRLRCQEEPGSAPIEAHSCGIQGFISTASYRAGRQEGVALCACRESKTPVV
jgi:hypothetical protein